MLGKVRCERDRRSKQFSAIESIDGAYNMQAVNTRNGPYPNLEHSDRSSEEAIITRVDADPSTHYIADIVGSEATQGKERYQIRTTTTVQIESHSMNDEKF